jgi:hypothetical protein
MRIVVSVLLMVLLGSSALLAAEGDVSLAGRVVLRIRYPAAGYTVSQRADSVQARLNQVLSMGEIAPADVRVAIQNKETAVFVRDQLIITVDWTTARANKTTPDKLGQTWADNLRQVLPEAMPKRSNRP